MANYNFIFFIFLGSLKIVVLESQENLKTKNEVYLKNIHDNSYSLDFKVNKSHKSRTEMLADIFRKKIEKMKAYNETELVILVDGSSSIGSSNFISEMKYIQKVISDVNLASDAVRLAVITYSTKIVTHVNHLESIPNEYHKCSLLNYQLPNIKYFGGSTNTRDALIEAERILFHSRPNAQKVVFLVSDGFSNRGDPVPIAERLKRNFVRIFTFGIENGNVEELRRIASRPVQEHSYLFESFGEFEGFERRALHQDLKPGTYVSVTNSSLCNILCEQPEEGGCCDNQAECSCGLVSGHFSCLCPPGYYGTGLVNEGCQLCPNGTYSDGRTPGDGLICFPCPDIHQVTMKTPATSKADCVCTDGYVPKGDRCEVIKCPELSPPTNGYFVKQKCSNVLNAACGIRCHMGFILSGSSVRICQKNGTWSGIAPNCEAKRCSPLKPVPNSNLICSNDEDGYELKIQYNSTGDEVKHLVKMLEPKTEDSNILKRSLSLQKMYTENANIEINYSVDTECAYTCLPGYFLIGSKSRSCLPMLRWSGLKNNCKVIKCHPLPKLENGHITPENCTAKGVKHTFAEECRYSCNSGYELKGPKIANCTGRHGSWSGKNNPSKCVDVEPPNFICPPNVTLPTDEGVHYATVKFSLPNATDNSGKPPVVWSKPPFEENYPLKFIIGTSEVEIYSVDDAGNYQFCAFRVFVKDTEKPKILECESPPIFFKNEFPPDSVEIKWKEPVVDDNSGIPIPLTRVPASSEFPLGVTPIIYTATDSSGNNASCSLNITILENPCSERPEISNTIWNCTTNGSFVKCNVSCSEGFSFASSLNSSTVSLNCTYSGRRATWDPDLFHGDIDLFPECSEVELPNEILNEIVIDASDELCDDLEKLSNDLSNEISPNIGEDKLSLFTVCEDEDEDEKSEEKWEEEEVENEKEEINENKNKTDVEKNAKNNKNVTESRTIKNEEITTTIASDKVEEKIKSETNKVNKIKEESIKDNEINFENKEKIEENKNDTEHKSKKEEKQKNKKEDKDKEDKDKDVKNKTEKMIEDKEKKEVETKNGNEKEEKESIKDNKINLENKEKIEENKNDTEQKPKKEQKDKNKKEDEVDNINVKNKTEKMIEDKKKEEVDAKNDNEKKEKEVDEEVQKKIKTVDEKDKDTKMTNEDSKKQELKKENKENLNENQNAKNNAEEKIEDEAQKKEKEDDNVIRKKREAVRRKKHKKKLRVGWTVKGNSTEGTSSDRLNLNLNKTKETLQSFYDRHHGSDPNKNGTDLAIQTKVRFRCRKGSLLKENLCVKCPKGTFHNIKKSTCDPCPVGQYQTVEGQTSCTPCPEGYSTRKIRRKHPQQCKKICRPGTFGKKKNRLNLALGPCRLCPKGTFQPLQGETSCLPCPEEHTTIRRGSTDVEKCLKISEINDPCHGFNCRNGGTCYVNNGFAFCRCAPNNFGAFCERTFDPCSSSPCYNSGTCVLTALTDYKCECPSGYEGINCERETNECASNPCGIHGECIDLFDGYRCDCFDGFRGENCDERISQCEELQPCLNSATCVDVLGFYKCNCPDGFSGFHCEEALYCHSNGSGCVEIEELPVVLETDACFNVSCGDYKKCEIQWDRKPLCVCEEGYRGDNCLEVINPRTVLNFPKYGVTEYLSADLPNRDLNEISICVWIQTKDNFNYGTLFSYATHYDDNAFTLTDYSGLVLYVSGNHIVTDLTANDGAWHFICVTWQSRNGKWNIYLDGSPHTSGNGLSNDSFVPGGGKLVVGQEQDFFGGGFNELESFAGRLTYFDVWDRVLEPFEIKKNYEDCEETPGNLIKWTSLLQKIHGNILEEDSPFCRACFKNLTLFRGQISYDHSGNTLVAKYECEEGFFLKSDIDPETFLDVKIWDRKCMKYGNWENKEPKCSRIGCVFPGYFLNGKIIGNSFLYGDVIQYKCEEEYTLVGNDTRICQVNGTWSGEPPTCRVAGDPNNCKKLVAPRHGSMFVYFHSKTPYGKSLPSIGDRVEFTCDKGFILEGFSMLTCLEGGIWDRKTPICQEIKCQYPTAASHLIDRNIPQTASFFFGDELTITCSSGTKKFIACGEFGTWNYSESICKKCLEKPEAPNNGFVVISNEHSSPFEEGETFYVKCNPGFLLLGDNRIKCSENGTWTQIRNTICDPLNCGPPPQPHHPYFIASEQGHRLGDKVFLDCAPGFQKTGDIITHCGIDGVWSQILNSCTKISCGVPVLPEGYKIDDDRTYYYYQDSVRIKCPYGQRFINNVDFITCQSNGYWSRLPVCY